MKAIVWTNYGAPEVLQLQDIPKPSPKEHEVLIKIHAASVSAGDCEIRSLKFPMGVPFRLFLGLRKPQRRRVLGQELAGEVEAVGTGITRFRVGDAVFGTTGLQFGAYADYACLSTKGLAGALALKPLNMSYAEAAVMPIGGLEALYFLRQAQIRQGEKVLINGAGGSIGTAAVQLAKYYGAEVTAIDKGDKLAMLKSIGADHVIDYLQTDFTKSGAQYDVIFDVVGKTPFSRSLKMLNSKGRYLIINSSALTRLRANFTSKRLIFGTSPQSSDDLLFLKELIEAGKLKAVIDRTYPLEQMVEAHHYVDKGLKKGNVSITL